MPLYTVVTGQNDTAYIYKAPGTTDKYMDQCASRYVTNLTLSCDPGEVLVILYAYVWWDSRVSDKVCPIEPDQRCGTYTEVVAETCNGRESCTLGPGSFAVSPKNEKCNAPNVLRVKYNCLPCKLLFNNKMYNKCIIQ